VFGQQPSYQVVTIDRAFKVSDLQPLRLQFQRETEPMVADPVQNALPWDVAEARLHDCD
jgi:hypothetical protein